MTKNAVEPSQGRLNGTQSSWLPVVAYAVCAVIGAGSWLILGAQSNGEAWDNPQYFLNLVPALAIMAALLGYVIPHRPWRWGIIPYLAQAIIAVVQDPFGNLLPLGLILFVLFAGANVLAAYVGSFFRQFKGGLRDPNSASVG